MPVPSDTPAPRVALRFAAGAAAAVLLVTSASAAGRKAAKPADVPPPPVTPALVRDESGFTLTQTVEVAPAVRADYASATALLAQKQYAQGIAMLVRVTEAAPKLVAPFIDLGMAYHLTGELDNAEASLRRALELNPHHPVAHNELGRVLRRKGKFTDARASYERALQEAPELHFSRLNLAILCDLYLADLQCALDNYVAYQQAVPDDKQATTWIADVRARSGRRE